MNASDAASLTVNRERAIAMSPADDALVVLLEAAVSRGDLVAFAELVLLRAAVTFAARVESLDVLGLEVLIRIAVVVPVEEHVASMAWGGHAIAASWKSQTLNRTLHL